MGDVPVANPAPGPRWRFPRRALVIACALAAAGTMAFVGVMAATPEGVTRDNIVGPHWVDAMRADDLPPDLPAHLRDYKVWMVKLDDGRILALYHSDPRLGCTVPWRPDFQFRNIKGWFRNPCHSQTYDLTGACFYGPCIRGLDRYETRVTNGEIQVRIGKDALIHGPPVNQSIKPYVAKS